jgi:hypothetical protein
VLAPCKHSAYMVLHHGVHLLYHVVLLTMACLMLVVRGLGVLRAKLPHRSKGHAIVPASKGHATHIHLHVGGA